MLRLWVRDAFVRTKKLRGGPCFTLFLKSGTGCEARADARADTHADTHVYTHVGTHGRRRRVLHRVHAQYLSAPLTHTLVDRQNVAHIRCHVETNICPHVDRDANRQLHTFADPHDITHVLAHNIAHADMHMPIELTMQM